MTHIFLVLAKISLNEDYDDISTLGKPVIAFHKKNECQEYIIDANIALNISKNITVIVDKHVLAYWPTMNYPTRDNNFSKEISPENRKLIDSKIKSNRSLGNKKHAEQLFKYHEYMKNVYEPILNKAREDYTLKVEKLKSNIDNIRDSLWLNELEKLNPKERIRKFIGDKYRFVSSYDVIEYNMMEVELT